MEIKYLWIEDIGNQILQRQNFNFGGEYRFEYKDKKLEFIKDENYIHDFFQICSYGQESTTEEDTKEIKEIKEIKESKADDKGEDNVKNSHINITSIIGKNGAGKTTLLDYIMKIYNQRGIHTKDRIIVVFYKNGKYILYCGDGMVHNIPQLKEIYGFEVYEYKVKNESPIQEIPKLRDVTCFYYSNIFNIGAFKNLFNKEGEGKFFNLSLAYDLDVHDGQKITSFSSLSLINDHFNTNKYFDINKDIDNFFNRQIIEQLKVFKLKDFNIILGKLGHQGNDDIILTVDKHKSQSEEFSSDKLTLRNNTQHIINAIYDDRNGLSSIQKSLVSHYLGQYHYVIKEYEERLYNETKDVIPSYIKSEYRIRTKNIKREIENEVNYWHTQLLNSCKEWCNRVNDPKQLLDIIISDIDNIKKCYWKLLEFVLSKRFKKLYACDVSGSNRYFEDRYKIKVNQSNIDILIELFENISKLPIFFNTVQLATNFKLSSGEEAMYKFLTKVLLVANRESSKGNITIFFDELDIYLHPEWQRQMVSIMLEWIKEIFKDSKNIQIIMTSNSPFILSDMPKSNVIALELRKDPLKNNIVARSVKELDYTFGANIHELLSGSFFMDYTIGQFAKEKIEAIVKDLRSPKNISDDEMKEIKKIIDNIGEPIIRVKMNELYAKKHLEKKTKFPMSYSNEIDDLLKEINKLEAIRNDNNKHEIDPINASMKKILNTMKSKTSIGDGND